MIKLKIFLTFDHELPLGVLKTTYQKALFDTTNRVLELADELQVKVTLFTDVFCALRFKEWDNEHFYQGYIKQIKDACLRGHDIQLHLHPHWITSQFKNGCVIPSDNFKLSDFNDKEYPNNIPGIIETGISFLKTVCCEVNPGYKCVAFRAGGFCISPNSDVIFSNLYKNGIKYDSSICRGYYFKSAISEVDFTHVPAAHNWFIGMDGNYKTRAAWGILEIPVAGKPKKLLEIPTRLKMKMYGKRAAEDHGAMVHSGVPNTGKAPIIPLKYKIKQALSARQLTFDNYTYSPSYLVQILQHHIHSAKATGEPILLSAIGHPKSMGDYSLYLMKRFVEDVRNKYGKNVEFLTYKQLSV